MRGASGFYVEGAEGFPAVAAAYVGGGDVVDFGFDGEVGVAAEEVRDGGVIEEGLAEAFASQVGFGEVPLGAVGWGEELGEGASAERESESAG